jgi:hypothetical protein
MLLEGPGKTWGLSLLCRSQTLAIKTFCTSALERTNVAFPNPGKFHTTISRTDDGDWPYATATCSLERPSHLSYRTTHGRPSITPTAMQSATSSALASYLYSSPSSEALHRLATAAIVTSTTNFQPWSTYVPSGGGRSTVHSEDRSSIEVYKSYQLVDYLSDQVPKVHSASGCTLISLPSEYTLNPCPTSKVACSREAAIVCIGDDRSVLCYERRAIPQPLAPGTSRSMYGITRA